MNFLLSKACLTIKAIWHAQSDDIGKDKNINEFVLLSSCSYKISTRHGDILAEPHLVGEGRTFIIHRRPLVMRDEWGGSLLYVKQSLTDVDTRKTQTCEVDGCQTPYSDEDGSVNRESPHSLTDWDRLNLRGGHDPLHHIFRNVKSSKNACVRKPTKMETSWAWLHLRNGHYAKVPGLCIRGGQKFDIDDFVDEDGGVSWGSEEPWESGNDSQVAKESDMRLHDYTTSTNNDTNIEGNFTACDLRNQCIESNGTKPTAQSQSKPGDCLDSRLRGGCQASDLVDADDGGISWSSDDPWGSEDVEIQENDCHQNSTGMATGIVIHEEDCGVDHEGAPMDNIIVQPEGEHDT